MGAVPLGERECRDDDFAWPDIAETDITCIDVFAANLLGPDAITQQIDNMLGARPAQRFWIHFDIDIDIDVLDQVVMPAVDSPGSPGIDRLWLENICAQLLLNPLCCGMTLSVFDPELDPGGHCVTLIVEMLEAMFHERLPGSGHAVTRSLFPLSKWQARKRIQEEKGVKKTHHRYLPG
ncbi:arginase family protein [Erwinia sp. MYb416]|uniref:arginase family protein n=1 Tax=Erwinia sp. MYb416 TaxID=3108532 RepID=UPI0030AE1409